MTPISVYAPLGVIVPTHVKGVPTLRAPLPLKSEVEMRGGRWLAAGVVHPTLEQAVSAALAARPQAPTNSLDSLYRALKARRRAQKRGEPTGDLDAAAMAQARQMAAPGRPRVLVKCPLEKAQLSPRADIEVVVDGPADIQWLEGDSAWLVYDGNGTPRSVQRYFDVAVRAALRLQFQAP